MPNFRHPIALSTALSALTWFTACGSSTPSPDTNGDAAHAAAGHANAGNGNGALAQAGSGAAMTAGGGTSSSSSGGEVSGAGGDEAKPDATSGTLPPVADSGAAGSASSAQGSLQFTRHDLIRLNLGEAVSHGDFNSDGKVDLLSGPYWWEGPSFESMHRMTPSDCTPATPEGCDSITGPEYGPWAQYAYDIDGDGWLDSIHVMRPDTPSYWYKNPGMPAVETDSDWAKSEFGTLSWEQTALVNIAGPGTPGLVGVSGGAFGWFELGTSSPWTFHVIAAGAGGTWEHGIGTGDIDGDGSLDFLNRDGWWSPPAAGPTSGMWQQNPQSFKQGGGGSQMFGTDVNGDGQSDVVSALDAHGYGVAWFEQQDGAFVQHDIVGGPGATNYGGIPSFSQPHSLLVADMDGDQLADIITGKGYYAHPPGWDPGDEEPPVVYVFKLVRDAAGVVTWEPHLVDSEVGVGKGFLSATDFNADGLMDFAVAGKKGVFLFLQK